MAFSKVNYLIIIFIIIGLSITFIRAQNSRITSVTESILLWKTNSDLVTSGIETDISKIKPDLKVLFYGRLGETWWKTDIEKGKVWIEKALHVIENPATDFSSNRAKLQAIRHLLKIVYSRDENISRKLLKLLTETAEELSNDEKEKNSKTLIETALTIVNSNPSLALNLGAKAIQSEKPTFSVILFWRLHNKNTSFANKYFQLGVNKIQTYQENGFLFQLKLAGLPELSSNASSSRPKPNELLRKRFLEVISDLLKMEATQVLEKKLLECRKFWFLGNNSQEVFSSLIPSKLESLHFAKSICENARGQTLNNKAEKAKSLKTIEDYLNAADETEDQKEKDGYRISAAGIAFKNKDYKRAIEILEDVSEEGRKIGGGIWDKFYIESWTGLVIRLYKDDEIATLYGTIKKAPDGLKPLLYLTVSQECNKNKDLVRGYEFITEARNLYRKVVFEPTNDHKVFFSNPVTLMSIPRLYVNFKYENDALESYTEAIDGLNKYIAKIPAEEKDKKVPTLPIIWKAYTNLPKDFFEKYFQNIQSDISNIEYIPLRIKLKIDVLKFSLSTLSRFEKESEKSKKR